MRNMQGREECHRRIDNNRLIVFLIMLLFGEVGESGTIVGRLLTAIAVWRSPRG